MAGNGREIKTILSLDGETAYKKAISGINKDLAVLASELKNATAGMNKNSDAEKMAIAQKDNLNKKIDVQKQKISEIKNALEQSEKAYGKNDNRTKEYAIQLNNAEASLKKMESELRQTEKSLDSMEGELKDNEKAAKDTGKAVEKTGDDAEGATRDFSKFGDALKSIGTGIGAAAVTSLKAVGAAVAAVSAAAAAAAVKLGKEVISEYGKLEQSLGGSEAVFGKYAIAIQKTGEDAYRTMGVTQNKFLETANIMGALFQGSGLDQQRSMEMTEKAMQRATDMASVMGIDVQTALDSVAGAAKGNFTMMDNLGVAMNATTLQAYATGKGLDFVWSTASQADKAEMAMQMFFERTEQYAGNFEKEATQTISGSIGLLKAAAGSLVAGLGNANADIQKMTQNLVDAFDAVLANIVPVLENIVSVLPGVVSSLVGALGKMLPTLLATAAGLFTSIITEIANLLPTLIPVVVEAATQLLQSAIDAIKNNQEALSEMVVTVVTNIVGFILSALPQLLTAGVEILTSVIQGIAEAIPDLIPALTSAIETIIGAVTSNLPLVLQAGIEILLAVVTGIGNALPTLIPMIIDAVIMIVNTLVRNLPMIISAALQVILALVQGLAAALPTLIAYVPELLRAIWGTLTANLPMIISAAIEIIVALAMGLVSATGEIIKAIPAIISAIIDTFANTDWGAIGSAIINGIKAGVMNMGANLVNSVKDVASNAVNGVKNFLGIKSPSRVMRDQVGKMMMAGMEDGIEGEESSLVNAAKNVTSEIVGSFKKANEDMNAALTLPSSVREQYSLSGSAGVASGGTSSSNNTQNSYVYNITVPGGIPASDGEKRRLAQLIEETRRNAQKAKGVVPAWA